MFSLTPAAYASFKSQWTSDTVSVGKNRLNFMAWTVTSGIANGGSLEFDDSTYSVTATPPSAANWHRVAQVQAVVAPSVFAAGYVVDLRPDCSP